jgi:pimeloyl-ACP methyl ester carboxylesterase
LPDVLGDVVVYTTADAKSPFYEVREQILAGAVDALRYLVEPSRAGAGARRRYERVILVGHSLGSQVALDAVNRLSDLVAQGDIRGFDRSGRAGGLGPRMSDVLAGLVTFGSPLDKLAASAGDRGEPPLEPRHVHRRLLDEMAWLNYFDRRDYVSGALNGHRNLTNVECRFPAGRLGFTHSRYWRCRTMYKELIRELLQREVVRVASSSHDAPSPEAPAA